MAKATCSTCSHPADEHRPLAGCLHEEDGEFCDCQALVTTARTPVATPPPDATAHDGVTYEAAVDAKPLNAQQQAVWDAMRGPADRGLAGTSSEWLTLAELAERTGFPEASVSARLRDLRKPKWGGHTVDRRRRSSADPMDASQGVLTRQWEYRLVPATA